MNETADFFRKHDVREYACRSKRRTRRQSMKRFSRLTNAHSKSLKHHVAMQAIWVAFYNFVRVHETIKQTPAMASGIESKPWTLCELIEKAATA